MFTNMFYDNFDIFRPVIIEIPHFAALRGREREIVILRSDNGESWYEHPIQATDDMIHEALSGSFEGEGSCCVCFGACGFLPSLLLNNLLETFTYWNHDSYLY